MSSFTIEGNIVLPEEDRIIIGKVVVEGGKVISIIETPVISERYIMPGLIDAHVHIESSMLVPSEFARAAVVHGTTATVSDPHEIANVLGMDGVDFMINNAAQTPFKFFFGAPSCVPATPLETSGAIFNDQQVKELLEKPEIKYLAEMMNFPGVISDDPQVHAKLHHARQLGKPIDGHAPGLKGEQLKKYIESGISTDHECFSLEEAREKASMGMKILIREGSAAKNFDELLPLLKEYPNQVMFCSDDKHPDDLLKGHINKLISRGLEKGYGLLELVKACTSVPAKHYGLNCGLLRPGDPADLIIVDHLGLFRVLETYIDGVLVAGQGISMIESVPVSSPNRFEATMIPEEYLRVPAVSTTVKVIGVVDGQLITAAEVGYLPEKGGFLYSDPGSDILKIVVMNRYSGDKPVMGFIRGFGLKKGAFASTVAHDSHNIIAVGVDDRSIQRSINMLIASRGGLSLVHDNEESLLRLPVAGIMSDQDAITVANSYIKLDQEVKLMGSTLKAPFMTLSFMSLLVIPELKLGDKGLFDGISFTFTSIYLD